MRGINKVNTAFYQALNEPKNNNKKRMKFGEKKWANTDHILMRINWRKLDER